MRFIWLIVFVFFICAGVANAAVVINSHRYNSPSAVSSLQDVIASAVFDLDATVSASYSGSGTTWSNLVAAPADGSAPSAYDFHTGNGSTSTTYPTFTGTAGNAAAYWLFDGDDYFQIRSGANTNFLASMHKNVGGSDYWFAIGIRIPDITVSATKIFTTLPATGANNYGTSVQLTGVEAVQLLQRGASNSALASLGTLAQGTDYLILISHSHSSNQTRYWFNNYTLTNVTHTFIAETTNANGLATIGAESDAGSPLKVATRMYSFAMGNEYLDNTKAAAIINYMETRHGRNYAP